jgi:hypothetical protein
VPEVRFVSESDLRADQGARLLKYLLEHGADEFSICVMALRDTPAPFADAFEDELGPYELPAGTRDTVTGNGVGKPRTVRLWTLNEQSLARILSFLDDGLFHCPAGPDGWLEDLTVYRRGELVLGIVSHELSGVLQLTPQEHADVATMGIPSGTVAARRNE